VEIRFFNDSSNLFSSTNKSPLFRHQLQINDAAVSPRSGIFSTVGADGILFQSLNARVAPRSDTTHRAFQYGRPILHLLRMRPEEEEDEEKENQVRVLEKHADCREHSWLEVRAGDAALLNMAAVSLHFPISSIDPHHF
jgi:hypothetical protein